MKNIPMGLIGLILAGAVAACLFSSRVNGQGYAPANDPLARWRETSQGMSSNAALAFYRLQSSSTVPTPLHPRFQSGAGATIAPTGRNPAHVALVSPGSIYSRPVIKPFTGIRPEPTVFERYWPLMLEGREDPKTGVIIWSLP